MNGMNRVIVIGEGIVGASVAFHLSLNGVAVTSLDGQRAGRATSAGAGIVSPGGTTSTVPETNLLMAAAFEHYEWLIPYLNEHVAANTGFEVVGELFVALDDDEQRDLATVQHTAEQRRDEGVRGIGHVEMVDRRTAQELFPALSDISGAVHISGAARIDGRGLREALLDAATQHGLQRIEGDARLLQDNGEVRGVTVGTDRIEADAVVLAGGAWSGELTRELGFDLPVEPQRGQIAHLTVPNADTSAWPILATFARNYILTFPTSKVVAGATREDGSGFDYRLTAGGVHEVLESAFTLASGLRTATLEEVRIGFRPKSPDGLPILGRVPGQDHLYLATGHGPAGLSLGAHAGALVADLVLGKDFPIDLTAYRPERFDR
jgi:D-amino-acid dehydrogenase